MSEKQSHPLTALTVEQTLDDKRHLDLLRRHLAPNLTSDQFDVYRYVCGRRNLDPFLNQIHAVVRKVKEDGQWVDKLTIQTGIDGFRVIGRRSGNFRGMVGPQWCGTDGEWKDIWLCNVDDEEKSKPPYAARVGILVNGCDEPVWGLALWQAYKQTYRDKQGNTRLAGRWGTDPAGQLAKCAEAQAWRKACPEDTSGFYEPAEFDAVDQVARDAHPRDGEVREITLSPSEPKASQPKQLEPCPDCGGGGGVAGDCPTCLGVGSIYDPPESAEGEPAPEEPVLALCPECGGSGGAVGDGSDDCPRCLGTGEVG